MSTLDNAPESGTHPVNVGHLVMGLAFAGLVVVWAFIQLDVVPTDDVRWLLPLPWLMAGAAGLIAVAFGQRRPRRRTATPFPPEDDLRDEVTADLTDDLTEEDER
jgi:hypothetical protein